MAHDLPFMFARRAAAAKQNGRRPGVLATGELTAIRRHDAEGRRGADQAGDGGCDRGLYRPVTKCPAAWNGGKVSQLLIV